MQFKHSSAFNEQSLFHLVSALVEDMEDRESLDRLGELLEKRKQQLG